jgi:hypothetical protein
MTAENQKRQHGCLGSKNMKNFFLSLKTTVWTLLALVCLFFIGSYMMPAHREVFGPMNDRLLFHWIGDTASEQVWPTWWFFGALAALVLLTINTIVCSLQAIKGRWSRKDFLLRIAPQVVHAGFLFMLLAHLLGAGWGYKLSGVMPEGTMATGLPENRSLYLRELRAEADASGFPSGWSAEMYLFENNQRVKICTLGPNKPLFYKGMGVYLKSFELQPRPAALLLVAKDPGAIYALVGGIFFTIGSVILLVLKWKKA